MPSTSQFKVHTPLLAMKSSGRDEKYTTLYVGTVGEIIDISHPSFVVIRVYGETLYTFARDLRDKASIESLTSSSGIGSS